MEKSGKEKLPPLEWHTEKRKINDLIPYEHNPQAMTATQEEQLRRSLQEFGYVEIAAINLDGTLIAGHKRCRQLQALGHGDEEHDVRVPNRMLTERELKRYNIVSNHLKGQFMTDMLTEHFGDLDLEMDFDFNIDDLVELEKQEAKKAKKRQTKELQAEEQELPEVDQKKKSLIKRGDIFSINGHRLMCGDSTSEQDVAALMNGEKAHMVFTDPPYNVRIKGLGSGSTHDKKTGENVKTKKTIGHHDEFAMASGEMTPEEFISFLSAIFSNLVTYSHDGSIHYVCMDWRHLREISTAGQLFQELKNVCVWNKDNGGMGTFYRNKHELVFVFKNGTGEHINNFELGQHGRYRTNVWDYPIATSFSNKDRSAKDDHPTPKPVQMVFDACMDCSYEGQIVLDLFEGSGTSLVAAEQSDRVHYGLEFEPKYIEVIIKRYVNYCRQVNKAIEFKHENGSLTLEQIIG